ncbi:putative lipoprotein YgaO [Thalassobacillus devorans]|uniref:Lipoprotein YgaO n=1 Tax=Thalassobacillus devorans TaxID=279813 RepID=A0ABQ1PE60_9BACI|nr:hypothetical protein [Thalassobacillus devorans]NIK29270.1 hypothetical protein [Thalassobacillus devorans]GGC95384.1 putative lipoprotein YgaO [Thalassobacillus devorans]
MKIMKSVWISLAVLGLFSWALVEFYSASIDISKFLQDPEREYMFEIRLIPFVAFFLIGGWLAFVSIRKKRKYQSWKKVFLLPDEFEESDEREKQLTAQACRSAYISMWYSFPVISALLLLYPFVTETLPYYPILVFALLPITQIITYTVSWKKNF